jgi:hypothetical protein
VQTKLSLYDVWNENQRRSDFGFCGLGVKPSVQKKVHNTASSKGSLPAGRLQQPLKSCKKSFLCTISEAKIKPPRISAFAFLSHVPVWRQSVQESPERCIPQRVSSRRMTTAFSGLQTKLSSNNVWANHQSPSDLSFCLLTSCPRVKPCKRESTALHSPKRIPAIRLQRLLGDRNKAVYVNKRAAKRQHNRSTDEEKNNNNNNNNNRDSATNAAISLMGKKENSNSPKKSF